MSGLWMMTDPFPPPANDPGAEVTVTTTAPAVDVVELGWLSVTENWNRLIPSMMRLFVAASAMMKLLMPSSWPLPPCVVTLTVDPPTIGLPRPGIPIGSGLSLMISVKSRVPPASTVEEPELMSNALVGPENVVQIDSKRTIWSPHVGCPDGSLI